MPTAGSLDLDVLARSHGPFTLLPCPLLLSGESPRSSPRRAGDTVRERKGEEMKGRGVGDQKKKEREGRGGSGNWQKERVQHEDLPGDHPS